MNEPSKDKKQHEATLHQHVILLSSRQPHRLYKSRATIFKAVNLVYMSSAGWI